MERRKLEVEMLQKRYGEAEVGPSLEYIIFKHFRLPPGWNRPETELLVFIPAGYPLTRPDNFYVSSGLRLESGQMPGNFSENQQQLNRTWAVFSVHIEGEWNPNVDLLMGHNLTSYMLTVVEKRLSELN